MTPLFVTNAAHAANATVKGATIYTHYCPRCGGELKQTGYGNYRDEITAVCLGCDEKWQKRKTSDWYQVGRPRLAPEKRKSIVKTYRVRPVDLLKLDELGGGQSIIDEALK